MQSARIKPRVDVLIKRLTVILSVYWMVYLSVDSVDSGNPWYDNDDVASTGGNESSITLGAGGTWYTTGDLAADAFAGLGSDAAYCQEWLSTNVTFPTPSTIAMGQSAYNND